MVQIAGHPGIYIEEFAPPSPIEGVGTSTAAFVGTAEQGPIGRPTRLFDWDSFKDRFGGFLAEQPTSYLAPAVYGFFLNGGTDCFVLRVGTGTHASANLLRRPTGNVAVLVAEALEEGPSGNNIKIEVRDSSYLEARLKLSGPGAPTALNVHVASSAITKVPSAGPDPRTLTVTVADNSAFLVGERVVLQNTNTNKISPVLVVADKKTVAGEQRVILAGDVATPADFQANSLLRSADIVAGQREILVAVPTGVRLSQVVLHGALVQIGTEIRTVEAAGDGAVGPTVRLAEGMAAAIDLNAAVPQLATLEWNLHVTNGTDEETFEYLSMHPEHPRYWATSVNSAFVLLKDPPSPPANPGADPRPRETGITPKRLQGGQPDDRTAAWSSLQADPTPTLDLLRPWEEIDLVCVPGLTNATAQEKIVAHVEDTRRFAILDAPPNTLPTNGINDHVDGVRGTREHIGHAALYYPWLLVVSPLTNRQEYWPPSGHIAGVYARTDTRGVHVAPANEPILGAIGLERRLTDREQDPLNLNGINVLRIFAGTAQPIVWGARTTQNYEKAWQYISTRRLFLYLEKSIERGIRSAIFAPNNPELWARLRRPISDFLLKTYHDGAFGGATPKDSFYVRIDEALNPESERMLGRLYIEIGVRPAYPAEFIVMRIGIWDGGSSLQESS
jgi:Bacteriophage tail sheath protein